MSLDPSSELCVECGMCCTGHLFSHANANKGEDKEFTHLGLQFVERENETGLSFKLPCKHWDGKCTVYDQPRPSVCGGFKCRTLREMEADKIDLATAQKRVRDFKKNAALIRHHIPMDGDPRHFDSDALATYRQGFSSLDELTKANPQLALAIKAFYMMKRNFFSPRQKKKQGKTGAKAAPGPTQSD